ncbi:MAG: AraC family transcriptional regulator [Clostridia bacterium]|nr:AraC family transcriptional regulator [Clostridia bacterium]
MHKSFEFVYVFDGFLTVTVKGVSYRLGAGECLLILPYHPHALRGEEKTVYFLAVFSGEYASSFAKKTEGMTYPNPVFTPDGDTLAFIKAKLHFDAVPKAEWTWLPTPSFLTVKSCVYAIASAFSASCRGIPAKQNNTLLFEILSYTEAHFRENITLSSVAEHLGYNSEYLSRFFHTSLGIHFKTLVNQYRLEYASRLILDGKKTITEAAFESGFQSIRSFNRVFLQLTGKQPSALLKKL